MKVSKAKVAENRAALIGAAAKLFKQKGFSGAGVIEICAKAGLTQGAFYGQFATKSALAAEACRQNLANSYKELVKTWGSADSEVLGYIESYLSKKHVDDVAGGCSMACYSGEIARQEPEVAAAFTVGTCALVGLIEAALHKDMPSATARSRALFLVAAMVGTVAMVRAIKRAEPKVAEEMLNASLKEARLLTVAPPRPGKRRPKGRLR